MDKISDEKFIAELKRFRKKFGSEDACEKRLFEWRWPDGFECPRCGHKEGYFYQKRKRYQCKACSYQSSLTAETIFHRTRLPLKKLFLLIFLLTQKTRERHGFCELQKLAELGSSKTLWMMMEKIDPVRIRAKLRRLIQIEED